MSRALLGVFPRRTEGGLRLLAVLLGLVVIGCGALPEKTALVDGPALQSELARGLGMTLTEVPPVPNSGLANVTATYAGRTSSEKLLVIVFDSPLATDQITGTARMANDPGARLIRRANVAILYQVRPGTKSRQRLVEKVMERQSSPRKETANFSRQGSGYGHAGRSA